MSLHDDALATLRAWDAPTPAQAALQSRYVDHLEAHPDGVYRSCVPDHLTASCLVLSADGSR
ncbi:MAG: NUDIX hydrolase, partial [Nocardioides sp.]|nr:NUDIX hydrolase [Nocardioides sp.]